MHLLFAFLTVIFAISPIDDATFKRMEGHSFPAQCTTSRSDLRLLQVGYYDFEGKEQQGEMVCHKSVANDLLDIFTQLHAAHYPIASMRLIDDFGADDERSMRANNTSCFCFRRVQGKQTLSKHSRGMAVDINPLQNPCVKMVGGKQKVQPSTATADAQRTTRRKHQISTSDLAYKLFTQHGWKWGGNWRSLKDYQHFEHP